MKRLANIHPGEVLLEEFLIPMDISPYRLAVETKLPQTRISQILKGKRRITADTALRFSRYFGNSAQFWLGLQDDYDIEEEQREHRVAYLQIKPYDEALNLVAEPKAVYRKHTAKKGPDQGE